MAHNLKHIRVKRGRGDGGRLVRVKARRERESNCNRASGVGKSRGEMKEIDREFLDQSSRRNRSTKKMSLTWEREEEYV